MNVQFLEADKQFQNNQTVYWFNVDGENYAIAGCNGDLTLLDSEGCPIDDCNDHDGIKDLLIPYYKAQI